MRRLAVRHQEDVQRANQPASTKPTGQQQQQQQQQRLRQEQRKPTRRTATSTSTSPSTRSSTRRRIVSNRVKGWAPSAADTDTRRTGGGGGSAMPGRFDARVTGSGWWWKGPVFGGRVPWRSVASGRARGKHSRFGLGGGDAGMEVEQRLRVQRTQDLGEGVQQEQRRRRDRASVVLCCFALRSAV